MTVGEAVRRSIATLDAAGVPEARANAELLLAYLLDTDRGWLFVHRDDPLDGAKAERYRQWVARRATRVPLQHVTGVAEFRGLAMISDSRALVPRPETEGLVDVILGLELPQGSRVADLGTGSGCIAVALAVERPDLEIEALDCSAAALELARENADRHAVADRIRFHEGELSSPPSGWRGKIAVVVSNPPYGSETEWPTLEPEVCEHDPREAFVAGRSGLEAYRALAAPAAALLRPDGYLVLELGAGQAAEVGGIVSEAGFELLAVHPDFNNIERVLVARRADS